MHTSDDPTPVARNAAAGAAPSLPPDDPRQVAGSAAAGGAAPNLLALAARLRTEGWLDLPAFAGELVSLAVLAFVGCAFVWSQKETDMRKAFFLGVSAPALILNAMAIADRQAATSDQDSSLAPPWAVQVLYAAEQPPKTRDLSVQADMAVSGDIYIRDASSHRERRVKKSDDGSWAVPVDAFRLAYRGKIEDRVPVETPWTEIPGGSRPIVIQLHVQDPKQTFLGGVLDGFNLDNWAREFVRSEATAEVVSR